MNQLDFLHLQLRLEGFEIVDGNRIRQVEAVPGEETPLMLLAQLADGQFAAYFDESLKPDLYLELMEKIPYIHFPRIDELTGILKSQSVPFHVGHYKTYLFPAVFLESVPGEVECSSRSDPKVREFGFGDFAEHVFVAERDGRIASACVSTHEDDRCGEAWVCTNPQYRHRGLARQVVSAWARDMLFTGKVPFYSHKAENLASASLAARLGLQPVFEEIVISSM